MSFQHGLLHLTNWLGNTIMPTIAGLFFVFAVIQFSRGYHHLYSNWSYAGLLCLTISGLLRAAEKFTSQLGANDPDLYWNSILNLVNWLANVILPAYAGLHVTLGALKLRGLVDTHSHHQLSHGRHFVGAILCLSISSLLRLAEFFVSKGTGGVT